MKRKIFLFSAAAILTLSLSTGSFAAETSCSLNNANFGSIRQAIISNCIKNSGYDFSNIFELLSKNFGVDLSWLKASAEDEAAAPETENTETADDNSSANDCTGSSCPTENTCPTGTCTPADTSEDDEDSCSDGSCNLPSNDCTTGTCPSPSTGNETPDTCPTGTCPSPSTDNETSETCPTGTCPSDDDSSTATDDNSSSETSNLSEYEARVIELVNQERAKNGLAALSTNDKVQAAAEIRAKEQVQVFSHTRPNGSSCFTALDEVGATYSRAGENIAMGQKTPEQVVEAWMNSAGHRANILSPNFKYIGAGYYNAGGTSYWSQMFTS